MAVDATASDSAGEVEPGVREAAHYYDQVVAALAGLPPAVRQDLIEDLPDHLAEVAAEISAEGHGSLRDRLGTPEAYAVELQAAAGLQATELRPGVGVLSARTAEGLRRVAGLAQRLDRQGGRLVGYPRLVDLARAVRPGWWVLRGWLVAQFLSGAHDRQSWSGFVPDSGGSRVFGLALTLAMIAGSVALGRQSLRWSAWAGRAMAAASILVAVWGAGVLADNVGGTAYAYFGPSEGYSPFSEISDVYAYDQAGRLVPGIRLFDQSGNPIEVGDGYCADGQVAPGANPPSGSSWSYPACPADPGPFRSGPGPVPTTPGVTPTSPAGQRSAAPTNTAPAPSATSPSATSRPVRPRGAATTTGR